MGNSIRKTGPRTKRGKAVSKLNAIAHGVTAVTVPPSEQAAYRAHRAGFHDAYQPANAVEEFLCDRIAMTAWRMRRLDAWEAFQLEAQRRKAVDAALYPRDLGDLFVMQARAKEGKLMRAGEMTMQAIRVEVGCLTEEDPECYLEDHGRIDGLERAGQDDLAEGCYLMDLSDPPTLAQCAPITEVTGIEANALVSCAYAFHEALMEWGLEPMAIARAILDREPTAEDGEAMGSAIWDWEWEPAEFRRLWLFVDAMAGGREGAKRAKSIAWDLACTLTSKGRRLVELAQRARALLAEAEQGAIVPCQEDQAKFHRYDTGLERSLFKAMHELEALQEKRRGGAAPLARVEVHGDGREG
jgi:hypothetical protein